MLYSIKNTGQDIKALKDVICGFNLIMSWGMGRMIHNKRALFIKSSDE
jgi:hypothetical protein